MSSTLIRFTKVACARHFREPEQAHVSKSTATYGGQVLIVFSVYLRALCLRMDYWILQLVVRSDGLWEWGTSWAFVNDNHAGFSCGHVDLAGDVIG